MCVHACDKTNYFYLFAQAPPPLPAVLSPRLSRDLRCACVAWQKGAARVVVRMAYRADGVCGALHGRAADFTHAREAHIIIRGRTVAVCGTVVDNGWWLVVMVMVVVDGCWQLVVMVLVVDELVVMVFGWW